MVGCPAHVLEQGSQLTRREAIPFQQLAGPNAPRKFESEGRHVANNWLMSDASHACAIDPGSSEITTVEACGEVKVAANAVRFTV